MAKAQSLSVHRNTVERRCRKAMQADMIRSATGIGKQDVVAYAIVAISADGTGHCDWNTGSALPLWAFADTCRSLLDADITASEVEDTWRPSLQERKGL